MNRSQMKHALIGALEVIGSHGLSGVVAEASSFMQALEKLGAFPDAASTADGRSIAANLRRSHYVEIRQNGAHMIIQPSVKGIHRLQRSKIDALTISKPRQWDGTWRMVSYDMPARHAKMRRLFTTELRRLGFTLVKDSTWFHPYPCFDALSELIGYCGLSNYVMVAEISRLDEVTLRRLHREYPTLLSPS